MNRVKTNYKQCTIATLSLWTIYLLVIVIGMSISEYIEAQDYHRAVDLIHMNWISNLVSLSIPLIPPLMVLFVLIRQRFLQKIIVLATSIVFIFTYNIQHYIWRIEDPIPNGNIIVMMTILSMVLFLLISLYSWIALKIIKYQSN